MFKILVVAALLLVACGEAPTEEERAQTGSRLACNHFRNVMGDVSDGILTPTELRDKLQEVDSDALIATPEVQAASKSMLRAATQDSGDEFLGAVSEMDSACSAAGH